MHSRPPLTTMYTHTQCKGLLKGKNEEVEVTIKRQKTLITEKSNQIEMLKKSWKHLYIQPIQRSVSIQRLKSPSKCMCSSRFLVQQKQFVLECVLSPILIETQSYGAFTISYKGVKTTVGYNFRGISYSAWVHNLLLTLITSTTLGVPPA